MLKAEYEARVRGLTQKEIANRIGVSPSLIGNVFRGNQRAYPKLREGIKVAIGWEGDADELFEEITEVR